MTHHNDFFFYQFGVLAEVEIQLRMEHTHTHTHTSLSSPIDHAVGVGPSQDSQEATSKKAFNLHVTVAHTATIQTCTGNSAINISDRNSRYKFVFMVVSYSFVHRTNESICLGPSVPHCVRS